MEPDVYRTQGPEQGIGQKGVQLSPGAPIQYSAMTIVGVNKKIDFFKIVWSVDGKDIAKAWN